MGCKTTFVRQQLRNISTALLRFSVGSSDPCADSNDKLNINELGVNDLDGTIEVGYTAGIAQIPSAIATDADNLKALTWNKDTKSWDFATVSSAVSSVGITFNVQDRDPDTSNPAVLATRNAQNVMEFDPDVDKSLVFSGSLLGYKGGGLDCAIVWVAKTATTGRTRWNLAIERSEGGVTNIDVDSFAGGNSLFTGTTNGTNGVINYHVIQFGDGSNMDNLADGERFRIKLIRDADHPNDDMPGFAQFMQLIITET